MERPRVRELVDVVLVGGGHTHIQVLRSFGMDAPAGVRTTVVVDDPIAVYSGMVPGFVAGQYRRRELEIDVLPLARLAGARVILAEATGIDPAARRVELEGRPPIPYDLVSFDIGSTVTGLSTPGVRERALATRPIGGFVERIEDAVRGGDRVRPSPFRVAVVGGGAGGVELAFTLERRLRDRAEACQITLIEAADDILAGYPQGLRRRVEREAEARGIHISTSSPVHAIEPEGVVVGGERSPHDLVVWVTGAAGHRVLGDSALPTDERGFVRTRSTLQVEGFDEIFAVGDCGALADHGWVPKAGVYAVRQGPVLSENLRRALSGRALRRYRPQRDFLTLLNLGDGTALGVKWGLSFGGRGVFKLKDYIDRRFMRRFQVLGEADEVSAEFSSLARMRAGMDMVCGGCAAKLGQSELERVLGRLDRRPVPQEVELGLPHGDDAAAYRTPGGARVVSSVDQFRAFTDDPFLVGRVGAVNAASDVFAKGVKPRVAQALIALPEEAPRDEREELLFQVMAGAQRGFGHMGVTLVGGHTTTASELLVGFQVEGFADPDQELLAIDRLETERTLILTKPLGTGVLFHADMKARVRGPWLEATFDSMLRHNGDAACIARSAGATAATDVTGFGLARHLAAMLKASGVSAVLDLAALPRLPGAGRLLAAGLRSTFHGENERAERGIEIDSLARGHENLPLLYDPQTSGGLVFGVAPAHAEEVLAKLDQAGYRAAAIGRTAPYEGCRLRVTAGDDSVGFAVARRLR